MALYSEEEIKAGIDFPVVLLEDLAEKSAKDLEELFKKQGFDVLAVGDARHDLLRARGSIQSSRNRLRAWAIAVLTGVMAGGLAKSVLAGLGGTVGVLAIGLAILAAARRRPRALNHLFELRDELAPVPPADRLLSEATMAAPASGRPRRALSSPRSRRRSTGSREERASWIGALQRRVWHRARSIWYAEFCSPRPLS